MLDAVGADLKDNLRQAMEAVVVRDEMGPHVGEVPPDFALKRTGSQERVRLSLLARDTCCSDQLI